MMARPSATRCLSPFDRLSTWRSRRSPMPMKSMMLATACAPRRRRAGRSARAKKSRYSSTVVLRVDAGVVRHEAGDPPHLLRLVDDRVAADARVAALRRVQRRQDAHRRRLAGAVRADEAEHLAALDAERDVVHGAHAVEVADEPVELRASPRSWLPLRPAEHEMEAAALDDAGDTPGSQNGERSRTARYEPARLVLDEVRELAKTAAGRRAPQLRRRRAPRLQRRLAARRQRAGQAVDRVAVAIDERRDRRRRVRSRRSSRRRRG